MEERCICATLRQASRAITKLYGEELAPAGVNAPQFAQLQALKRLGPATIGRLAEETDLDRSTLGRNVRILEGLGLVRLGPGSDERTRIVALTSAGQRAVESATPLWASVQEAVSARLGPRRTEQLLRLLSDLTAAAE